MNNLYRELAPISDAAWADIEQEARRTFEQHVAARRVVDLTGPDGPLLASVNTGHLAEIDAPADGVMAHARVSQPLVRLRVPFTVSRDNVDAVRARRAGRGLAAGQGRGQEDRLCRGPGRLRGLPGRGHHRDQGKHVQRGAHAARRGPRLPERRQPGGELAAAGRGGRPVLAAAVRRRLHDGERDLRSRLPDPRAPGPRHRRGDHLGARHRRRVPALRPRRRLRAAPRPGPVDRLPLPRRRHGAAVLPGVPDVPRLHRRGQRGPDAGAGATG